MSFKRQFVKYIRKHLNGDVENYKQYMKSINRSEFIVETPEKIRLYDLILKYIDFYETFSIKTASDKNKLNAVLCDAYILCGLSYKSFNYYIHNDITATDLLFGTIQMNYGSNFVKLEIPFYSRFYCRIGSLSLLKLSCGCYGINNIIFLYLTRIKLNPIQKDTIEVKFFNVIWV